MSPFDVSSEVTRLAVDHHLALTLLADTVATFRLPANRALVAKQLPELVPIVDAIIARYVNHFERNKP